MIENNWKEVKDGIFKNVGSPLCKMMGEDKIYIEAWNVVYFSTRPQTERIFSNIREITHLEFVIK